MSIGESPPQRPPMLSPDGKWVWSGTEWLPIAGHAAVFAAWNSIRVDPVEAAPPVAQAPVVQAPAPVMQYPAPQYVAPQYAAPPPEVEAVPLWRQQRSSGLNKYLYFVAGGIALVVAFVAVNSLGITWPWSVSPPEGPSQNTYVVPPAAVRSDAGRADYYLNGFLTPPMAEMTQDVQVLKETCNGAMTVSCQQTITTADKPVKKVLSAIDKGGFPTCISPTVAKLRVDIASMDGALLLAKKGFIDNLISEVAQGVSSLNGPAQRVPADVAAITAQKARCDTQHVGP